MPDNETVGWHQWLNGHEFEQAPQNDEGQGSLVCCSPHGCKESDTTEQLNNQQRTWGKFYKIKYLYRKILNIQISNQWHSFHLNELKKNSKLNIKWEEKK